MKKIIVVEKNATQRIDKFLAGEFFSYSRGEIVKSIKAGNILVNREKTEPSYKLKEGDEISTRLEKKKENVVANPKIKIKVIHQNPNFIIIDKPAGLQVHPDHNEKNKTLVNGLLARFPEIRKVRDASPGAVLRPGIVHRLDKDTSGVMVVARNQETFAELKRLFQERKVVKKYVALIHGKLKEKKGEIRKPIARAANYRKQTIAGVKTRTKIRPAITKYQVLKELGAYSLVEAIPKTGRMHQLRIHFSSLGTPVIGDRLYCRKNLKKKMPRLKRHLLHARRLEFALHGEKFAFQVGLPEDFRDFLDGIPKKV